MMKPADPLIHDQGHHVGNGLQGNTFLSVTKMTGNAKSWCKLKEFPARKSEYQFTDLYPFQERNDNYKAWQTFTDVPSEL